MSTAKKLENNSEKFLETREMTLPDEDLKYWKSVHENLVKNKQVVINNINEWMKNNTIGVNKFCKQLDINSRQYYRLMDPEENITLRTISEIATLLNCDIEVKFIHKSET